MEKDTRRSLREIQGSSTALVKEMLEIQKHRVSRERAEEWASHLRFLCVSEIPEQEDAPPRKRPRLSRGGVVETSAQSAKVLRLSDRSENPDETGYVAVSYRWVSSKVGQSPEGGGYSIQTSKGTRPSKVSSRMLDRVIRYAQSKEAKFIWIDQECIDQDDPEDKEIGIQSMDLVYKNSLHPVGLLNITIGPQDFTRLQDLLYERFLIKKHVAEKGMLKDTVDQVTASEVFEVLRKIQSDEWWTRTWIYQEEYCASARMCLLIARSGSPTSENSIIQTAEDFPIYMVRYRKSTTKFCLACDAAGYPYEPDILDMAAEYKVLTKTQNDHAMSEFSAAPHFHSMSSKILGEIDRRQGENVADRLAIFANCCNYSARLDTVKLADAGYGLSTCILALYLLNGEIIQNHRENLSAEDLVDPLSRNVLEYLNRYSFSDFKPVGEKYHLSQIHDFRLVDVEITLSGIETSGWLWEIYSEIDLTHLSERFKQWHPPGRAKTQHELSQFLLRDELIGVLASRVSSLHHSRLATMIRAILDRNRSGNSLPRIEVLDRMLQAVIQEIAQHGKLALGRIVGEREPSGLFITRSSEATPFKKTHAFTSWDNGNGKSAPKFVSLEVSRRENHDHEVDHIEQLCTKSWLNGLWFTSKASTRRHKRYVFPWQFESPNSEDGTSGT